LGLAVVDGIVKSLGGEIHVQSTLGQGSTFTVWLPITHEAEIAEPVSLVTAAGPRSGAHILVVDDEAMVGQTTGRLLESMGYRVVICQSGAEALGLISDSPEPFDLVLTDLIMPGLSGDKLMETLAASHPDLPVILCTGFVERLDVTTQNRLSNAHRLLRKPFTKDELADVVRAVLLEG
jgi:CheY-like chemotaxis protein